MRLLIASIVALVTTGLYAQTTVSPAENSIRKAQAEIAKHPGHAPYYNALAMAYARRAREVSDTAFYAKADETLTKSLSLAPGNFEALKARVWLMLGRHEFAQALEAATKLNKQSPDDITIYGYLADANAELGNYKAAVDATQWMLNLRAGNIAGLTRAAYLRELHGDLPGAIELMRRALDSTPLQESEERAWLLTQLAHLHLTSGDLPKSELYAKGALSLFPNYHYALGALAKVRQAQDRHSDAAVLLDKRYQAAPHAENLFALAAALHHAGKTAEAEQAFTTFEKLALREADSADNANHELIAFYVDFANKPADALRIAEQELQRRRDVGTLDAYAWALAASGDLKRADAHIRKALALGGKDPVILKHAASIQSRLQATVAQNTAH
jgi:tetratricopeptide (TPR) repeat protein